MSKIEEIAAAVSAGKSKVIGGLVLEALDAGLDPLEILNVGMIGAMGVVGERFKSGEIFVPEMLIAARAMKAGVEVLKPKLSGAAKVGLGTCIIGTVAGDMHDIGKNLVSMMIESAGFTLIDLGVDVKNEAFLAKLEATPEAKLVALSCLLTTTMPAMRSAVAAMRGAGVKAKIIVGGAPVTQAFAAEIGADGYAPDAASAATAAKGMVA
ncbi:MAG: cobalamin-dependent protein [Spirochaetaceae bacterium]|jgi:methanogenic corrinoid protein MtbC1|nr:cobalamin-dependent protein [Spirochaetaceae bacterium]